MSVAILLPLWIPSTTLDKLFAASVEAHKFVTRVQCSWSYDFLVKMPMFIYNLLCA